jgi:predicted nucleotidyltransferase
MGRERTRKAGLAGALFARVQLRLLALLFGMPDRTFHVSELIRLAESGSGAVQRELKKLAGAGIVSVAISGNRRFYQANRHSPVFEELHGLIVKTVGLVEPLRNSLKAFAAGIDVAFIYGSVAKGEDTAKSDIDLMIIGRDVAYGEIYAALQKAEKTLLRTINPNLMTKKEWNQKLLERSSFISKILQQPKLFVFGTQHELEGIG